MQFQPPSQPGWGQQEPGQYPQQQTAYPQWQQGPDGRWYQVQPQAQVQPYYPPQQPGYLYPQQQPYYQQQPVYSPNIMVAVNQSVNVGSSRTQQYPFIWRLLYFLTIGWFLGLLWLFFAVGCFMTILGIPVGVIMLNYLPAVMTLQKH